MDATALVTTGNAMNVIIGIAFTIAAYALRTFVKSVETLVDRVALLDTRVTRLETAMETEHGKA